MVISKLMVVVFCRRNNVVNKAKGRISKRVFQENKARQIFRKTKISYPLIRTHTRTWVNTFMDYK